MVKLEVGRQGVEGDDGLGCQPVSAEQGVRWLSKGLVGWAGSLPTGEALVGLRIFGKGGRACRGVVVVCSL